MNDSSRNELWIISQAQNQGFHSHVGAPRMQAVRPRSILGQPAGPRPPSSHRSGSRHRLHLAPSLSWRPSIAPDAQNSACSGRPRVLKLCATGWGSCDHAMGFEGGSTLQGRVTSTRVLLDPPSRDWARRSASKVRKTPQPRPRIVRGLSAARFRVVQAPGRSGSLGQTGRSESPGRTDRAHL
jgi:hypothetical protein